MGQKFLIDTNVISHLFSDKLPENGKTFISNVINESFNISVIVEIEVLTHHEIPGKMPLIEEFIRLAQVYPLDEKVKNKVIELRRKKHSLKLGDAIIAATSIVHNLSLITNNTKDFNGLDGIEIIDPHKI